jgi:acetylornithine deacetylase
VGYSTYPERCVVTIERRTLPGETPADALRELQAACDRVHARQPAFRAEVACTGAQVPSDVSPDAPIARALEAALGAVGEPVRVEGLSAWTDAALLNDAGIPAICFGPGDIALAHADEEWVATDEIERATRVLTHLAGDWCRRGG